MGYCEICGYLYGHNGKCPRSKVAHSKIDKLISDYGNIVKDAIHNPEALQTDVAELLEVADNEKDIDKAYTALVMVYYIRFLRTHDWKSSISFKTYWGMLIHSCPEKFDVNLERYKSLYGEFEGLKKGMTYALEETKSGNEIRVMENSLFFIYTDDFGWILRCKKNDKSMGINFKELPRNSSEDYVMGYAKCLAVYENWL